MDTPRRDTIFMLVALLTLTSLVCVGSVGEGDTTGDSNAETLSAILTEISGTVQVLKEADGFLKDAFDGQKLEVPDQVVTYTDGRVRINFSNGTMMRLSPQSTFTLEAVDATEEGPFTRLKLEAGKLWIILRGGSIEVDTPSGLASVRGSYLMVWVPTNSGETHVQCLEGDCFLGNDGGGMDLVAGQKAFIQGANTPPHMEPMSQEDVDAWLAANPEATEVMPMMTETMAAWTGADLLKVPSATSRGPTATAADCGPPPDWVLYTVGDGDTLQWVADLYRVSITALQKANCLGGSEDVFPGQGLFVPNVPTTTPTPTNTATPTSTAVPATPTPTNSPAVFTSAVYPTGTIATCLNSYSINASDANGIDFVKLYYSTGAADPKDTGTYHTLSNVGGSTYAGEFYIDTLVKGTTVKFRFAVWDSAGAKHFYPDAASAPLSYNDGLGCGASSTFTIVSAPPDGPTLVSCTNDYKVKVSDPDGVNKNEVYVYHPTFGSPNDFTKMTYNAVTGEFELLNYSVPAAAGDTVKWYFKAYDMRSDVTLYPAGSFSFTSLTCP